MSNAWNGRPLLILGGLMLVVAVGVGAYVAGKADGLEEMEIDYEAAELAKTAAEDASRAEQEVSARDQAAAEASADAAAEAFEAEESIDDSRGAEESGTN